MIASLLKLFPASYSSLNQGDTNGHHNNEEFFRIIKKLPNIILKENQFERMIAFRLKSQQIVCIFKALHPHPTQHAIGDDLLYCFTSDKFVEDIKTPLVRLLLTENPEYSDENNSCFFVMNCLLRERLSRIKVDIVSHGIILQIIYQYMKMMKKMEEFFKKPHHQRKCNRPEVVVDRFDKNSGRIELIFGSTDLLSIGTDNNHDKVQELSNDICTGRNDFEREMVFGIVEFLTQENLEKNLNTKALVARVKKYLKTNEFSSYYLNALQIIINGGSNALANLIKTSLFSGQVSKIHSLSEFYNSLCEDMKKSKEVFLDLFQDSSAVVLYIPKSLATDKSIIKTLVEKNPSYIQYADADLINDRQFIMDLIDINPMIVYHTYLENFGRDEELWLTAISKNPIALLGYSREHELESESFKQKLKEVAIEHGYLITRFDLEDLFTNDREAVIKLLSRYGNAFSRIPNHFQKDMEIAKVALSNCGFALMGLPIELKNELELVVIALKENPTIFNMVNPELKSNPEVLLAAGKSIETTPFQAPPTNF